MPLPIMITLVLILGTIYLALVFYMNNKERRRGERRMRGILREGREYSRQYHETIRLRRQLRELRQDDARVLAELALLEDRMRDPLERIEWDWKQEGF